MTDKDTARAQIAQIVENFRQTPRAKREAYNEDETRHFFILPLFRALGWDTQNPADMSAETQISKGRVDFAFYLSGVPAFYLETKRIREDLEKPEFIQQAINYAYLKGVTWAVLSDFEGVHVYNAEWETNIPSQALVLELAWEEYAGADFEELWLLSKPAMQERLLDKLATQRHKKARRRPVTELLFKNMTTWRADLFSQITHMSGQIWAQNPHEVDNAVQRLLDRLIFLRTAEDRGLEPHHLKEIVRQNAKSPGQIWPRLSELFRELDAVYNSNLFAPALLDNMDIHDPSLLTGIINDLYKFAGVEFDFNAITADVLGAVYEQYLGFRAQDLDNRDGLKELRGKQEKRKKQGIYYTPQYIVRYIVQQTVDRLLEDGADPHALRVLDPACGSGSFLIEAFDVLDRWIAAHEPDLPATERRRRILTENLYGVDLDDQAVEVTRLNLLLRATYERGKLPILTHIRHGNSLIDDRAIAGETAFCWEQVFPEVFTTGGFDVIIGNPPYVRIQNLPSEQVAWMNSVYETTSGNYDIYIPFVERGLDLLGKNGLMAYILPNKFFTAHYGSNLRKLIAEGSHVRTIVNFGDEQVFEGAMTYTCVLVLSKAQNEWFNYVSVSSIDDWRSDISVDKNLIPSSRVSQHEWQFSTADVNSLIDKLSSFPKLEQVVGRIFQGIVTSADDVFVIEKARIDHGKVIGSSRSLGQSITLERELVQPLLKGALHIRRYSIARTDRYIVFPYIDGKLIDAEVFKRDFPLTWEYMLLNKERLEKRENDKMRHEGWYGYVYPKNLLLIPRPKLLTPSIAERPSFAFDEHGEYYLMGSGGGGGGGYGISASDARSTLYLLGVLNSRLTDFMIRTISSPFSSGWFAYSKQYIAQLPIRIISRDEPDDLARHDQIIAHVEEMIALKQRLAAHEMDFSDERFNIAQRVDYLDKAIDAIVYELYGLTEAEIALVEAAVPPTPPPASDSRTPAARRRRGSSRR